MRKAPWNQSGRRDTLQWGQVCKYLTPTPRPRKRSGPSCQLLVNSQPERSSPAEVTTGGNYGDVERRRRHLAAFSSSTSHEQLMQTRKRGEKKERGEKKKGLLDPPPPLGSRKWTRLTRLKSAMPTGQSLEVLLGTKVSLRSAAEPCVSSDTLEVSGPPADGRHFTQ